MTLKLYFIPGRSWLPRWLLGEMGEPFELVELDFAAGETRKPAYLAVNPLGKLPALEADGQVITETAAICLYLADLRPKLGLAPSRPGIAVAVDGALVPRRDWADARLSAARSIEIISASQGG